VRTSLVSALALAATLAAAAPTHADPSLPAGWIAGGPAKPMAAEVAPSPRSLAARRLEAAPRRPALTPVQLSLEAFERVEVEPVLTAEEVAASHADPVGEPATEMFVDKGCSNASVAGHAIGTLTIGSLSEPIGPNASGGPYLFYVRGSNGSDGEHRFARALWETVDRMPDGTLRYIQGVGRFELSSCKTTLASRFEAIARPILGGLAYLFRTRCVRCAAANREELHVIAPTDGWGSGLPYSHHVVSLAVDGADIARLQVQRFRLDRFTQSLGHGPIKLRDGQDMLIGVEVAKGLGEAAPTVIAYATGVPHTGG
jgi:hypothetical protein